MRTKIFTLLVCAFWGTMVFAQQPSAVIKKATVAPVIDGTVDNVWAEADSNLIDKSYTGETPTVGDVGDSWWKALWNDDGVYVLVNVNDDVFAPAFGAADSYLYDHPEIYFDTNVTLVDGKGPLTDGNGGGNGHYQFAPHPVLDSLSTGIASSTGGNGSKFCYNVSDPAYLVEYFIPFPKLLDQDGVMVDKTGTIGFDVTICDSDIPAPSGVRHRSVWSNIGTIAESWNNMDECGTITLEGAEAGIFVETITITGGTITTDKGTLQMTAVIAPVDATNQTLKWSIEGGTAQATISSTGLLSAVSNGTVIVKASSTDGSFVESQPVTVDISGQIKVTYSDEVWNTYNLIKNWNFDLDMSNWGGWVDPAVPGQIAPVVQDGVCAMKAALASDNQPWHYQHNQIDFTAEAGVPYTLMFKSWSSAKANNVVDFEDTPENNYTRYGTSSDPEAINGESEWHYMTSTTPFWFTFHVMFDRMVETTVQKIQWMISLSDETIYLDSVLLVKDDELGTGISEQLSANSMRVYPNPVGKSNILTVELGTANSKVAIYNAVGQKIMEKVAVGNFAKFDVASLQKGLYFVRLENGVSQKFLK